MKFLIVAGARPNFMKIAPLIRAIHSFNSINPINPITYLIIHTGQHYDVQMSETFFKELDIPKPDINLEVGSGSHATQTAEIMKRFEPVLLEYQPDVVIVVGDVNSTLACALTTSKIQYPIAQLPNVPNKFTELKQPNKPIIAHIEAGLRSFDRTMPEEINRIVTDSLSDLLFTPSEDADENLLKEGIPFHKIKRVGNIMIDTLITNLEKARKKRTYESFNLNPKNYVFVTLHRPNNVDDIEVLTSIMKKLTNLSKKIPVIFPVHPRTKKRLSEVGISLTPYGELKLLDPIGYLDTICLVDNSRFVLTDSGGLQEETTFLQIPCLTLRPNTERPITIEEGTNKLTSLEKMEADFDYLLNGGEPKGRIPDLWDGRTAYRIIKILTKLY